MKDKPFVNHCLHKNETNSDTTENPTANTDIEKVKQIINLEKIGILDKIAEENREKIDNNITCEEVCYIPENSVKKEKIAKLKEMIEKLENEN